MASIDDFKPSELYFNRDLNWLEFNHRVLQEGLRKDLPLLERVKFLAIVPSNLDEFFMVRVGGLSQAARAGSQSVDASGMTPLAQLRAIMARARQMMKSHDDGITETLDELAKHGLAVVRRTDWSNEQRAFLDQYFAEEIEPILTPLAIGEQSGKPLLPAMRLHIAVRLAPVEPSEQPDAADGQDASDMHFPEYVVIPLPGILKRFISIPSDEGIHLALLDDLAQAACGRLIPGRKILATTVFRITRDSDVAVDEDETADLLQNIETVLSERNRRHVVRLEIEENVDPVLREYLIDHFETTDQQVIEIGSLIDATALFSLASFSGFSHLKDEQWPPQPNPALRDSEDLFATLRENDVLMSLPYEQFDPVVQLVQQASTDPGTLAIRMVLYRTAPDSPLVAALIEAAKRGKQVTILVELKARFDEARNVAWARALEDAGCDVIYGIAGFKTHAKVLLILRREEQGIRRYAHLGTGNYNDKTARLYGDVGLFTSDEEITADVVAFTNLLTGLSQPVGWNRLSISPVGIRRTLERMIEREISLSTPEHPGHIIAKMNSLQCPRMIALLYRASQAGVRVDLNIRGICCLRPGVPGLSENIRVTSIIDRFLEHARIFYFHGGGRQDVFLASADWMVRNLDKRLETMFPILSTRIKSRLIDMLHICMADNVQSWELGPDGTYERVPCKGERLRAQEYFYDEAVQAATAEPTERMVFMPRRKQREE